jgi:hypothetical protein
MVHALRAAMKSLRNSGTDFSAAQGMGPREFFEVMGTVFIAQQPFQFSLLTRFARCCDPRRQGGRVRLCFNLRSRLLLESYRDLHGSQIRWQICQAAHIYILYCFLCEFVLKLREYLGANLKCSNFNTSAVRQRTCLLENRIDIADVDNAGTEALKTQMNEG